ncbi:MAG: hypothetical protein IJF92_00615 [Bacilli bacterium]|nr:hypothetical protein [Bacilli bacterium]MBQ3307684.1 hypothetical protein [Bacilli bacterium]
MRRTIRLIESQNILNKKLFKNQKLIPEVREHLLKIAQEFLDNFSIDILVDDINLIGSNAGYNYKSKSDIDLHIITDFTQYPADVDIIDELFNAKKNNFNSNYDITIKDLEVELYIEDVNNPADTNGRYSIKDDTWLQEPTYIEEPPVNKELVEEYTDKIEEVIKSKDLAKIDSLIDEIWDRRKNDVKQYGFIGEFNLVFKSLRAKGLLDKLRKTKTEVTSEELSLE